VQRVLDVEAAMISASPSLKEHIAELDKGILLKAADIARLTTSYGELGGVLKLEQFVNGLSASEWETFRGWWKKLSAENQDAILGVISQR
jgi:hypothetical protein